MKLYNLLTLLDPNMSVLRKSNGKTVYHDTVKGMLESAEADGAYQYALETYEVLDAKRVSKDMVVIEWKD